jgi:hypothetical protein
MHTILYIVLEINLDSLTSKETKLKCYTFVSFTVIYRNCFHPLFFIVLETLYNYGK